MVWAICFMQSEMKFQLKLGSDKKCKTCPIDPIVKIAHFLQRHAYTFDIFYFHLKQFIHCKRAYKGAKYHYRTGNNEDH